jgi:hypothetical protein
MNKTFMPEVWDITGGFAEGLAWLNEPRRAGPVRTAGNLCRKARRFINILLHHPETPRVAKPIFVIRSAYHRQTNSSRETATVHIL